MCYHSILFEKENNAAQPVKKERKTWTGISAEILSTLWLFYFYFIFNCVCLMVWENPTFILKLSTKLHQMSHSV